MTGEARTGRSARATSIFPVCVSSLLRRRYISSRRKKFNVAVKADGNADCGLRASPVTALHRMVHISRVHRPFAPSSAAHWPSASLSIPWIPSRLIPRRLREALGGLWILTRGSQNTSADIAAPVITVLVHYATPHRDPCRNLSAPQIRSVEKREKKINMLLHYFISNEIDSRRRSSSFPDKNELI